MAHHFRRHWQGQSPGEFWSSTSFNSDVPTSTASHPSEFRGACKWFRLLFSVPAWLSSPRVLVGYLITGGGPWYFTILIFSYVDTLLEKKKHYKCSLISMVEVIYRMIWLYSNMKKSNNRYFALQSFIHKDLTVFPRFTLNELRVLNPISICSSQATHAVCCWAVPSRCGLNWPEWTSWCKIFHHYPRATLSKRLISQVLHHLRFPGCWFNRCARKSYRRREPFRFGTA